MKKTVSLIMSVIMVLTVLAVIPLNSVFSAEEINTLIDFENAQTTFYNTEANKIGVAGQVDIGTTAGHGNVMHFSQMKVYRDDGYRDTWNTVLGPTAFRLVDKAAEKTLYFEKGRQYTVSFKMKKNSAIVTSDFNKITAALVFDESYSYQGGNIKTWVKSGKTAIVAAVDLTADSDWVEYKADITVPVSGYGAFLLYGGGLTKGWKANCDIDVDDISITPCSTSSDKIDFEGNQAVFYSTEENRIGVAEQVYIDAVAGHGNVMHFSKMKVYRDDGYKDNWNTVLAPTAFRLIENDASGTLYFEKGDVYNISFKIKKNADIASDFFNKITAAVVFDTQYSYQGGNIKTWVNDGKTVSLAELNLTADSDWVEYNTVFTVPVSGYGAFLLYGGGLQKGWVTNCDIDVDDIKIDEISDNLDVTVNCHNYDNKGGSKQLTAKITDDFSQLERPFSPDARFDGWYLDEALTKPATGVIKRTGEIWVKWSTEVDSTVNTYDEENVEFVTDTSNNFTQTTRKVNGVALDEGYFAQYNAVVSALDRTDNTTNSIQFTNAQRISWNWPALVKIYDSKSKNLELYTPNANTAYKLKFKYYVGTKPTGSITFQLRRVDHGWGTGYNADNIYLHNIVDIADATSGWVEVESIFYTGDTVSPIAIALVSTGSVAASDINVWIDDISVTEIFDTPAIYFDTMGGLPMSAQVCIAGNTLPTIGIPVNSGYLFDGWYCDSEYKKPFELNVMPYSNIRVYAKWVKAAEKTYGLEQNFETCDYSNDGTSENLAGNNNSDMLVWQSDKINAYDGNGYIAFDLDGTATASSLSLPAVSFKDSKGENYQIVKDGRYRIRFAMRSDIETRVYFATTQQVPTFGVSLNNTTAFTDMSYSDLLSDTPMGDWGYYELYFIAGKTGKLYLMLQSTAIGKVYFDSVSVDEVGEDVATRVKYYDGDKLISDSFGKVGTLLDDAGISNKEGFEFNGWRTSTGTLYADNYYPVRDTDLYASWVEAEDLTKASSDWSNDIVIDFEDSENAKIFYGVENNSTHAATGVFYMVNDPENAHSGNSYYRFKNMGIWSQRYYRKMRFYDKNSVGNMVYLEPLSVYKITYWLNLEKAGTSSIMLATFDSTDSMETYTSTSKVVLSDAEQINNIGKWVQYEGIINTGDKAVTLGMVFSGGYLSASLDDIVVKKLKDVTVHFESNGGTEISDITALQYDCVVEPARPTREGYTFAGWHSEKELTDLFKFVKTPVTEDITLYAKWEKSFVPETKYRDEISYTEVENEVPNEIKDAYLDEKIEIIDGDKIEITQTGQQSQNEESSVNWLLIVIISAVILLVAAVILIIVFIKRKKV